jgi:hypothetical protein
LVFPATVPTDLQALVGRRIFKRTLRTSELAVAQLRALQLAARYAQAFDVLREQRMGIKEEDIDALLRRLTDGDPLQQLILNRTKRSRRDGDRALANRHARRCRLISR